MTPKTIHTEADYAEALARIEVLMEGDPEPTSPEGEELELLVLLVERYETVQFPMDMPSSVEATKFRMDQQGVNNQTVAYQKTQDTDRRQTLKSLFDTVEAAGLYDASYTGDS